LIKNKTKLNHKDAIQILESGLDAANPDIYISNHIKNAKFAKYDKIWIIATGKAADSMARIVHSKIKLDGGIIVIPKNYTSIFSHKKFKIFRAGHPTPTKSSILAAKSIIKLLKTRQKNDLVIFLISGGTSPLVCLPFGISLAQKQAITNTLVKSGATIAEINAIRKHLSQIKGGRILQHLNCSAISYVMSDVLGEDLGTIASGLTYCDSTTYSDCIKIIKKYKLKIPKQAQRQLNLGMQGKIPETPKKPKIKNIIIAKNTDCLSAMKKTAQRIGYDVKTLYPISGSTDQATNKILKNFSFGKKNCLIFGGETTVKVTGKGKGGRNQELVLTILSKLKQNATVSSIGTDGIDGVTNYAGAVSDYIANKKEMKKYLQNNDSNSYFAKHGGLIKTGPTHTNLMDIGLIMS
jgi:hydroxypyruvate reductase